MSEIDSLEIKIKSEAKSVSNEISRLEKELTSLSNVLGNIGNTNLGTFSKGMRELADGMQKLQSVKMSDFTRTAKGIEKISQIDGGKLQNVSSAMVPLANSLNVLGATSFDGTGITNFINAITRLANSNVQSLNSANFVTLGSNINKLTSVLQNARNVDSNTIQITNAVARLASAGDKASAVSTALPLLSKNLRSLVNSMSTAGKVSGETIQLSQAIALLANAGKKAEATASGLGVLATELKKFFQVMSTAPAVSGNIIQMTNAIANLANASRGVGNASRSIASGLNGFTNSTSKASKGSHGLASALGKLYATYFLLFRAFRLVGRSIDISSDLTEVQNVVDNTFGDMKYKVEDFAQNSIKQLGMSELSVKQYASRFQAMGTAMGITAEQVGNANAYLEKQTSGYIGMSDSLADVSLNLTKLTADMASFYNMSQEAVAQDLESVYTGMTRPLRQYGLDLTEATLKEWAMRNGLNANIDTMTQAEKTMLRYQYVLANTSAAQGDFARTSQTWANQIRILKEQFVQLGGIVGTAFINMLKPLVAALNTAMGAVINFAETVVNALGVIFGWKLEITSGSLAQDFEDAAAGASDLASGTGKAADNAKKLKQQLQGFQELNVLTSPSDSGSGGGGGAGGVGGTGAAGGGGAKFNIVETESAFKSQIDTLYKLGEYIGDTITKGLNDIKWDKVYQGAKDFGKGLADFLNGLISPDLFGAVGKTIAGSLNTAIYAALSFGENFDFDEFGLSIATGINDFFKTFDFKSLAKTFNTWAHGILSGLSTAIGTVDWGEIGKAIGEFINDIEVGDLLLDLGELALNILKALGDAIKGLYKENPLAAAIITVLCGIKFTNKLNNVGSNILTAIGTAIGSDSGTSIGTKIISSISAYIQTSVAQASLKQIGVAIAIGLGLGEAIGSQLSKGYAYISRQLGNEELAQYYEQYNTPIKSLIGLYEALGDTVGSTNDRILNEATIIYLEKQNQFAKSTKETFKNASFFAQLLGIDLIGVGKSAGEAWAEIKNGEEPIKAIQKIGKNVFSNLGDSLKNTFSKITDKFKNLYSWMRNFLPEETRKTLDNVFNITDESSEKTTKRIELAKEKISRLTEETKNNVATNTEQMAGKVKVNASTMADSMASSSAYARDVVCGKFNDIKSNIDTSTMQTSLCVAGNFGIMSSNMSGISSTIKDDTISKFSALQIGAISSMDELKRGVSSDFVSMQNNSASSSESIRSSLVTKFGEAKNGAHQSLSQLMSDSAWHLSSIKNKIQSESWYSQGVNLVNGLKNGISNQWSGTLVSHIVSLARGLTANIKAAFGIHSPSRIWRDQVGVMLIRGLGVGISDGKGQLLTETASLANSINTSFFENLELAGNPFDEMQASMTSTSARLNSEINGTARIESGNLSNDIANGITSGMSMSQAEQNALLREQNELLRQLLSKDTSISANDIFESVKRSNRQEYNRRGTNPLVY